MNKINLALTSDGEEGAVVHLNATFETREMAIEFHAQVAALCRNAVRAHGGRISSAAADFWPMRLLKQS